MAIRKTKKNQDMMLGFTHKMDGDLFIIEIGNMGHKKAAEAVEAYKTALENPSMKKSLFIIRKEAKPMGAPARAFTDGMEKCEDGHILASALVLPSISIMHLVKMMTKIDSTDTQFFVDREKAEKWVKAWENKEQSKMWLKNNK